MKKRTIVLFITLLTVMGSYFLPYLEIERYEEDPTFFQDADDLEWSPEYESGIDLVFPLIALPGFLLVFLFISVARNKSGNIIALVFSILNVFPVFVILFLLHFDLFGIDARVTGVGFYLLALAQLVLLSVSIYNSARPAYYKIGRAHGRT